jgi:hypothetical protein
MKRLYFLGLISLWGITLTGQVSLNWQVTDDQNQPLKGVSVWKKGTYEGVTTDENGRFSITVNPGKDILELSYLGYENVSIKTRLGMKLNGNEMMFPISYNLDEITITSIFVKTGVSRIICYWPLNEGINGVKVSNELSQQSLPGIRPLTKIFPIPTQSSVYIQQETPLDQIDLYNLNGQKLQSFNFSDQLNASIDLSAWPAGTYFLRSSVGWVEKVILQK